MVRPTVFNKLIAELNDARLRMIITAKTEQDRRDLCQLFDIAINTLYQELHAQRKQAVEAERCLSLKQKS